MQQDKQKGAYIHQHIALQSKISAIICKLIIFSKRYPIPTFANTNTNITNKNDNLLKTINDIQKQGKTVALCKINGTNAGLIIFSDKIRDGVVEMIKNLKKDEIKETIMLTGDSVDNAKFIANQAAIDNYKYNLLPEDKVNEVKKLKEKFKNIVMVGDGINDAPALTTATTGIAMGAKGTAISAEAADVVLLVDDVTKVSDIIQISKRTIKIAKQSILVGSFICSMDGLERRSNLRACLVALLLLSIASSTVAYASSPPSSISSSHSSPPTSSKRLC